MRTIRTLLAVLSIGLAAGLLSAQTSPSVTLTPNSNAPGTVTILRAPGNCPATGVPSSGTALTSTLALTGSGTSYTATYNDSSVVAGNSYCYWATEAASGGGSGVSNTFLGSISVTLSLSGVVH